MHFFLKAILSGLIVLVVGVCTSYVIDKYSPEPSYVKCDENCNKTGLMELSLFFTGFFSFLVLEYFGFTSIYCEDYCKK